MDDIMARVDRWESGRADQQYDINDINDHSQEGVDLMSLMSFMSLQVEPAKPPFDGVEEATAGVPQGSEGVSEAPTTIVYPPCVCDEKPYPHPRHRDGTGPGSGRELDPYDCRQAHWSKRVK